MRWATRDTGPKNWTQESCENRENGGSESKIYSRDPWYVCMYVCVCKDSAAPAHARTRVHRPAAPHQSSGVSQTPHPTACPQAGIPHRPPKVEMGVVSVSIRSSGSGREWRMEWRILIKIQNSEGPDLRSWSKRRCREENGEYIARSDARCSPCGICQP